MHLKMIFKMYCSTTNIFIIYILISIQRIQNIPLNILFERRIIYSLDVMSIKHLKIVT